MKVKKNALKALVKILVKEFNCYYDNKGERTKRYRNDLESCKSFRELCDVSYGEWGYEVGNKARRFYQGRKS